jgi:sigma-B regulation protein RsbU (phosphoserine phosphatase)
MAQATPTVLVADDQPDVIAALRLLLRTAGFDSQGAGSVEDVRTHVAARDFDAVLMDLNYARDTTSGAEGLELISDLHARLPHLPLIAMTGWANVETAVEAMRRGARGYVPKPWNNEALVQVLRSEIDHARTGQDAEYGQAAPPEAGQSDTALARQSLASQWREAQAIHRALLPSVLPDVPGVQLSWRWEPASGFGGDYYDAFPLGPDRLALCIADVCGKGLPAALLVSSLQATVRAFVDEQTPLHDVVARINRALCRQGAHGRFVTLFLAVLDVREGAMRFCNAGHNPPILVRPNGTVSRLDAGGTVVGVFDGAAYDSGRTAMGPAIGCCSSPTASWKRGRWRHTNTATRSWWTPCLGIARSMRARSWTACSATSTSGPAGAWTTTPRPWRLHSTPAQARTAPSQERTPTVSGSPRSRPKASRVPAAMWHSL